GHRAGESAVGRIVREQQRVRLGVGEIVDRDELEIVIAAFEDRACHKPPDAPEPVDRYFRRHLKNSCYWPSFAWIWGTIFSAEKPKCSNSTAAGAEAPKRSSPIASPSCPMKRSQPWV